MQQQFAFWLRRAHDREGLRSVIVVIIVIVIVIVTVLIILLILIVLVHIILIVIVFSCGHRRFAETTNPRQSCAERCPNPGSWNSLLGTPLGVSCGMGSELRSFRPGRRLFRPPGVPSSKCQRLRGGHHRVKQSIIEDHRRQERA